MSVTINSLTFSELLAQPLSYYSTDVFAGSTARTWEVQGLCSKSDFSSLINIYDTWRDLKIAEENPKKTLVIGEHVLFSGIGPGGLTWTDIPCWFSETPKGAMVSSQYMTVTFTLIDAAQAIESFQKDATDSATELEVDFGEYILAGVTVNLTEYPDTYVENPTVDYTVLGYHYISGKIGPYFLKQIRGRIATETDVETIKAWYESIVSTTPTANSWYPNSVPTFSAEYVGTTLWYTVSIDLIKIRSS